MSQGGKIYREQEVQAPAWATFPFGKVSGAVEQQESQGRRGIAGPQTRYGQAHGLMQVQDATGEEMARKLGIPWRPDLMRGTSDEAAQYQRARGNDYLQEGFDKTGNIRDALRYYHGGPNRRLWGPKTNSYADTILRRLGGN